MVSQFNKLFEGGGEEKAVSPKPGVGAKKFCPYIILGSEKLRGGGYGLGQTLNILGSDFKRWGEVG